MSYVSKKMRKVIAKLDSLPNRGKGFLLDKCCSVCGKDGLLPCNSCTYNMYCSSECMLVDWPVHKHVCKKDESGDYLHRNCYDPACLHGALPESTNESVDSAYSFVVSMRIELLLERQNTLDNLQKMVNLFHRCSYYADVENPQYASQPDLSHLLVSMALDAHMDSRDDLCRDLLRHAVFFECHRMDPTHFSASIMASDPEQGASCEYLSTTTDAAYVFRAFMYQTMTREGLERALWLRVPCKCMGATGTDNV